MLKPGVALDQHDGAWLVFERNGELWAVTADSHGELMVRQINPHDAMVVTDWAQPRALRTLELVATMRANGERVPHVHKWEPRGGTLSGTMWVCACGEQKWDSSRPGVGGC